MGLHAREATDESSLLEVDGLANFAAERFGRLPEPAVYRPRLQAVPSTDSESMIRHSGSSPSRIPYEPAAGRFYATSFRAHPLTEDDDHRGFTPPNERDQAGDLELHGYRRPLLRQHDPDRGEMSPFIEGDAAPRSDYFREGSSFSNRVANHTYSRDNPAEFQTARYLGESTGVDANLEAEFPLPSRYTGASLDLRGGLPIQDRISTRLGGRRRRILARGLQAIGAIVVAGGALGATFYADPPETPPPAGSTALIALCILPFLSLCCWLYFFYLRHRRSRRKQQLQISRENAELRSGQHAYPTVNFIVDPGYFARMAGLNSNKGPAQRAVDGHEHGLSPVPAFTPRALRPQPAELESLYSVDSQSDAIGKVPPRVAYLQSEVEALRSSPDRRRRSNKESVENAVYDLFSGLCWLGLGIWTITEEARCPAGQFAGYCNLYNTALAFACLTGLVFLTSFVFDCLDYRGASRGRVPYGRSSVRSGP